MRPIGGELAYSKKGVTTLYTDSGRSSIRLFIRNFPNKKILIPDFLCKSIMDVLLEEGCIFETYHINENLEIDLLSIKAKSFEVLYIIHYFGMNHLNLKSLNLDDMILLEDCVFNFSLFNTYHAEKWFSFNSYRKISRAADGSEIQTNLNIHNFICNEEADFSNLKFKAKELKFQYSKFSEDDEQAYVSLFQKAESLLDKQQNIFLMSSLSHKIIADDFKNYQAMCHERKEKYFILSQLLNDYSIEVDFDRMEYSFFILRLTTRDRLKKYLFDKGIYLPVHWPGFGVNHSLYNELLSVPLFSEYTVKEIKWVGESIIEYLKIEKIRNI